MKRPDSNGEISPVKKSKTESEHPDLSKKLVDLIRLKKKLKSKKANIFLTLDDFKSFEKSQSDHEKHEWTMQQFFVQDMQRILLFSLIGNQFRFFPRWCRILRPNHIKSVTMISVNNLSEFDYQAHQKKFKKFNKIFLNEKNQLNSVEIVAPSANNNSFFNELMSVPITHSQWVKIRDDVEFQLKRNEVVEKYRKLFQAKKTNTGTSSRIATSDLDKIPRTSLLLSVAQMTREDYPLPFDSSTQHNYTEYVHTKEIYEPVTNKSPLYSIDCEMCYNIDGEMETVWLAVVNEQMECVYDTFVKPRKKINNFLTHVTGVSAKMIEHVTTDLNDVQKRLKELLPADAILCGQSLNNDLHSLKMFHPYIIDTSIIYNLVGNREVKPSLKRLSAQFLGKLIQESTHNPTIDAKASLQLVLLKLRQGLDFGDVIVNGCTNLYDEEKLNKIDLEDIDLSDPISISKFIYQTGINIDQNFFNVLRDNKIQNIYIDHKDKVNSSQFDSNYLYEDRDKAFELTQESINKCKFVWSQLYLNANLDNQLSEQINSSELKALVKFIRKIYDDLGEDSLLMVVFTGRNDESNKLHQQESRLLKGRCFLKYKCTELDELNKEIKELHSIVNQNNNIQIVDDNSE